MEFSIKSGASSKKLNKKEKSKNKKKLRIKKKKIIKQN